MNFGKVINQEEICRSLNAVNEWERWLKHDVL